jgi:hypothetical protein
MLVKFKVNLGSMDAAIHRLDFRKCTKGTTLECSDEAATWLVKKGIASEEVTIEAVAKPAPIQAVPVNKQKPSHKDS